MAGDIKGHSLVTTNENSENYKYNGWQQIGIAYPNSYSANEESTFKQYGDCSILEFIGLPFDVSDIETLNILKENLTLYHVKKVLIYD